MRRLTIALLAALLGACSSTSSDVTQERADNAPLPYPEQIYVYDFAVAPSELQPGAVGRAELDGAIDDPDSNPQRAELEHQIARVLSTRLVNELQALGLPAVRWRGLVPKNQNSYALVGEFLTIDAGSELGRMIIGFGVGGSEVQVMVQAYHVQGSKQTLLGEAKVTAESSKKPGLAAMIPVGAAVSGVAMAAAVSTGVGVVHELNQDVRTGAENTADAIVELLKPKMEAQGWF